jgi:hypothetical protein
VFGTGSVVRRNAGDLVTGFEPVSPRICYAQEESFFNYSIINAYAPTEVSSEEEKNEFFDTLERKHELSYKRHKILTGDMNAQAGNESE